MSKVMLSVTLVGGEHPWPGRTMTLGATDDSTLPLAISLLAHKYVKELLRGAELVELDPDEGEMVIDLRAGEPVVTTLTLGLRDA